MSGAGFNPFAGGEILKVSPTTEPQIEILTSAKISDEANLAFNEAAALNLEGVLDETLLKQCFVAVVNRHEVLNATFSSRADEICLQGQAWNAFTVLDYSSESLDEANQQKIALYQQIATSPMDLENGPLFFVWLLKMPNQQSSVVIAAHHLVCDGWSFGIVLQDLLKAYQNNGSLEPLSDDESFFYFAEKQKASKILNQDEDYWREKMTPFPAPLDLPLDQPRPLERPFQAKRLDYRLADDVVALLPKLAAASKGSVVNVALAAYVALLQRLSNNDDVVVGLPVAGQAALNQLNLVGHLVQLLPIRIDSNEDIAFDELIGRVKNAVMDATEHPNFTFGNLVKDAAVERNRVPLVSVLFNMDQAMPALDFNGIAGQVETIPRAADSFELFFNIVPSDQEWILEVTYSSVLYSETSILSWLHTYEDILREAAKQQSISLKQLRYAGQAYQQLVQRIDNWNNTEKDYALDTLTLDSLIAKACQEHAEHTAVFFEEHSLSYTDFNLKVSQLAKQLVDEGLQREQPVAVLMQRSEKLPVVLSAIMKAGGAYLPLDPEHPPERLAYIVASSNTVKAIVDEKFAHLLPAAIPCLNITKGWDQLDQYDQGLVGSLALPSSLAYIIYTSGSTGKPKGVMVEHQSVCNRLLWMQDDFSLDRNDKVLQKTPYTFDVSVWEFFMPLTIGASLVMAKPDGHKNPDYLIDIIKQHGISLVHFVPSMLSLFLDNEDAATCSSLKRVICSGEALNHKHQKSFFEVLPNASLYNFYGPTEAAIEVTTWQCDPHRLS